MLVDAVAQYIAQEVAGLSYSDVADTGNVFLDNTPSTPDRCVAIYSSVSGEPDTKLPYDPADFQVLVRAEASGELWAREMLAKIYTTLHGLRNVLLPGNVYAVFVIATQGSSTALGDDENGRPRFTCDYRTEVHNVTKERP